MITRPFWDYTAHAETFDKRPDYSGETVTRLLDHISAFSGQAAADIGAGTGRLTIHLLERGLHVAAVEPNDRMRSIGVRKTEGKAVKWFPSIAEDTGLPDSAFYLVTFGSSFNVVDRLRALQETARILIPGGWFACLWNCRDLSDPVQSAVEAIIHRWIPNYDYGVRREDQTAMIEGTGFFRSVDRIEGRFTARVPVTDYLGAWRSHATLARQAGQNFEALISAIRESLSGQSIIEVPYNTRAWCARLDNKPHFKQ